MSIIYFVEQNIYGAWVIYGINGVKQYYGYSRREAESKYKAEAKKVFFVNEE